MKKYLLPIFLSFFCFYSKAVPLVCRLHDSRQCAYPNKFFKEKRQKCASPESNCRLVYCRSYCLKHIKRRSNTKTFQGCISYCRHPKVQARFTLEERELYKKIYGEAPPHSKQGSKIEE